jgi:hypothetical protein
MIRCFEPFIHQFNDFRHPTLHSDQESSVCLGVETHLGLMTRYYNLLDCYCFVLVGHPV